MKANHQIRRFEDSRSPPPITSSQYACISQVFLLKYQKMCSKMAYNNNNKRFKQHIHLNFSLKEHFFECFISFKTCYAFEFYISTLKQKKLTMSKKKKKKKYLIEK